MTRCLSSGMPMPVSAMMKCRVISLSIRLAGSTLTTISPLAVNLMALPTRLIKICRSRPGSPTSLAGSLGSIAQTRSSLLRWAWMASGDRASNRRSWRSKAVDSSSTLLASILEKSRMSLIRRRSDSAEDRMPVRYSLCSGVRLVSRASSVIPRMPFIGVRIS